ncbi:hypothetical protein GJ744_001265 [Endocarpon pusillum]|uniref:Uncharacterized protein n=1 Tax=Endocarpon pusillum TaxID=364733 RepID=A0A8H7A9L3_9EURO|nr:hypothetical protein GJ744_001265 [Endocarpon pusillum]
MSYVIQATKSATVTIGLVATIGVLAPVGLLVSFALTGGGGGLQREICLARVRDKIKNENAMLKPEWFWSNGMDEQYPDLSLTGCYQLCNGDSRWYFDAGQRLMAWHLPLILLVANMDVSPLDKWRYLEVFHLLGDPIDFTWSLLAKVEAWSFCFDRAKTNRQLGTILAAIEEITGPHDDPLHCLNEILDSGNAVQEDPDLGQPVSINNRMQSSQQPSEMSDLPAQAVTVTINEATDQDTADRENEAATAPQEALIVSPKNPAFSAEIVKILTDAAFELADSRTDDIIRTIFAVFLYIIQLLAAFIAVIGGGNSSPPGGRIGTAMLLTWLIPAILLSNCVGGFASRRTCFRVIRKMVDKIRAEKLQEQFQRQGQDQARQGQLQKELQDVMQCLLQKEVEDPSGATGETKLERIFRDKEAFFRDQRWRGGSDVYRPEKPHHCDLRSKKYTWMILALSAGPVFVSFIFGLAIILKTPPFGFNCRSFMLFSVLLAWLLSACFTHVSWKLGWLGDRGHWFLILWKDVAVAVLTILLIFLSSVGLFNTCYCWSFKLSKGENAHVPLNVDSVFDHLFKKDYKILVVLCIFLQFAFFILMYVVERPGLKLMRWPEREKQMEFLEDPPQSLRYRIWQCLKRLGCIIWGPAAE